MGIRKKKRASFLWGSRIKKRRSIATGKIRNSACGGGGCLVLRENKRKEELNRKKRNANDLEQKRLRASYIELECIVRER